jgi:hypothetical protein
MECVRTQLIGGPSAWKRADVEHRFGGALSLADIGDGIGCAQLSVADLRGSSPNVNRLEASKLREVAEFIRSELLFGRGLCLVRAFCTEEEGLGTIRQRSVDVCNQLGELVPQNADGDLVRHVTDMAGYTGPLDSLRSLGHGGRAHMSPHSDSADLVALVCVRPARRGGASSVCSSAALYNAIVAERPEYLEPLRRGFHFDVSGKTKLGSGVTDRRIPVFNFRNGRLSCVFNKARIILGMKRAGHTMNELELASIEYLDALASSEEFSYQFTLRSGDVLFLNSHRTLHGREEYDDWHEVDRKRLLFRLWMQSPAAWDT